MNQVLWIASIGFLACTNEVHAQGTVWFVNLNVPAGLNAPVYEADRTTPLSGSQFTAELLGGSSSNLLASVAMTGFLSNGYFNGGIQTIGSIGPGQLGWVEVRVWNTASGSSFGQAQASGLPDSWWQSSPFTVQTGRSGVNPTAAGLLTGLGTSPVFLNGVVPEPGTATLILIGAALVFFGKRRRNVT